MGHRTRMRTLLALTVVAILAAMGSIAIGQTGVTQHTGCLTNERAAIYALAEGDAPKFACLPGDSLVHFGVDLTTLDARYAAVGHDHDDRYYTKAESDARFLGKDAKAADADKLDGLDSGQLLRSDVPGAVGPSNLADDSLTDADITDNSLSAISLATGSVGSDEIQNDSIADIDVSDNSLTADSLSADSVGADELANDAVDTAALQDDAVTGANILNGTVATSDVTANASVARLIAGTTLSSTATQLASPMLIIPGSGAGPTHSVLAIGQVELRCSGCTVADSFVVQLQVFRDAAAVGMQWSAVVSGANSRTVVPVSELLFGQAPGTAQYSIVASAVSTDPMSTATASAAQAMLSVVDLGQN